MNVLLKFRKMTPITVSEFRIYLLYFVHVAIHFLLFDELSIIIIVVIMLCVCVFFHILFSIISTESYPNAKQSRTQTSIADYQSNINADEPKRRKKVDASLLTPTNNQAQNPPLGLTFRSPTNLAARVFNNTLSDMLSDLIGLANKIKEQPKEDYVIEIDSSSEDEDSEPKEGMGSLPITSAGRYSNQLFDDSKCSTDTKLTHSIVHGSNTELSNSSNNLNKIKTPSPNAGHRGYHSLGGKKKLSPPSHTITRFFPRLNSSDKNKSSRSPRITNFFSLLDPVKPMPSNEPSTSNSNGSSPQKVNKKKIH